MAKENYFEIKVWGKSTTHTEQEITDLAIENTYSNKKLAQDEAEGNETLAYLDQDDKTGKKELIIKPKEAEDQ